MKIINRIGKTAACFVLMMLSALYSFAQTSSALSAAYSGSLTSEAGTYAPWTDNAPGFSAAASMLHQELYASLGQSSVFISGDASLDRIFTRSPSEQGTLVSDDGACFLQLKEAYADYTAEHFGLRIGRQIAAWGKADGMQIADILCPKDYTRITADDYSSSRLGIDAIRLSVYGTYLSLDAYWIPFFTPSPLPLNKTNPLRALLIPQTVSAIDVTYPDLSLENGQYACKAAASFSACDIAAYFFYGYDSLPVTDFAPVITGGMLTGVSIDASYKKMTMTGIDAAVPAGPFVFRAEGAWYRKDFSCSPDEVLLHNAPPSVCKNEFKVLAGFDWSADGWTVTAQYYEDFIADYESQIAQEEHADGATLSVSKSFFRDTLSLSLEGVVHFIHLDSAVCLSASYSLTDSMTLSAEAQLFSAGKETGEYGAYKDLSNMSVGAVYRF